MSMYKTIPVRPSQKERFDQIIRKNHRSGVEAFDSMLNLYEKELNSGVAKRKIESESTLIKNAIKGFSKECVNALLAVVEKYEKGLNGSSSFKIKEIKSDFVESSIFNSA